MHFPWKPVFDWWWTIVRRVCCSNSSSSCTHDVPDTTKQIRKRRKPTGRRKVQQRLFGYELCKQQQRHFQSKVFAGRFRVDILHRKYIKLTSLFIDKAMQSQETGLGLVGLETVTTRYVTWKRRFLLSTITLDQSHPHFRHTATLLLSRSKKSSQSRLNTQSLRLMDKECELEAFEVLPPNRAGARQPCNSVLMPQVIIHSPYSKSLNQQAKDRKSVV